MAQPTRNPSGNTCRGDAVEYVDAAAVVPSAAADVVFELLSNTVLCKPDITIDMSGLNDTDSLRLR